MDLKNRETCPNGGERELLPIANIIPNTYFLTFFIKRDGGNGETATRLQGADGFRPFSGRPFSCGNGGR